MPGRTFRLIALISLYNAFLEIHDIQMCVPLEATSVTYAVLIFTLINYLSLKSPSLIRAPPVNASNEKSSFGTPSLCLSI